MNLLTKLSISTAAVAFAAIAASASSYDVDTPDDESVDHVEIGALSCDVGDGSGFIIGSSRELTCTFNPIEEGLPDEAYVGEINRWGLDVGATTNGQMSWLVLAPTEAEYSEGALEGSYKGVSAEATLGVGVGANVMTLGSEDTLALQPISVTSQNGVNLAVGVGEINLTHVAG